MPIQVTKVAQQVPDSVEVGFDFPREGTCTL